MNYKERLIECIKLYLKWEGAKYETIKYDRSVIVLQEIEKMLNIKFCEENTQYLLNNILCTLKYDKFTRFQETLNYISILD